MGGVLHRVDEAVGPGFFGPSHNRRHVVDSPQGIAGVAHSDQLCAGGDLAAKIFHIQRAGLQIDVHPLHRRAPLLGGQRPGHHIGVVIQPGQHNFVAGAELPGQRAAEMEGEGCHIVSKDHFVRVAAQQISHGLVGRSDHRIRAQAGFKAAVGVGIAPGQVVHHRPDHIPVDLRAAGVVEKYGGPAVILLLQGRELLANRVDIQHKILRFVLGVTQLVG